MIQLEYPKTWWEIVLWIAFLTELFYLLFLVYCAIDEARDRGVSIPKLTKILVGPPLIFGYLLDILWNITIGTVLFLEFPWQVTTDPRRWTFTLRLKSHKYKNSWRGKQANWWTGLLNPFDPGHV